MNVKQLAKQLGISETEMKAVLAMAGRTEQETQPVTEPEAKIEISIKYHADGTKEVGFKTSTENEDSDFSAENTMHFAQLIAKLKFAIEIENDPEEAVKEALSSLLK